MRKTFLFIFALCATIMAWGEMTTGPVTYASIAKQNGWAENSYNQTLDVDGVISVTAKWEGTTKNGKSISNTSWRIYQKNLAGEFAINAAPGFTIKTIKLTYATNNNGVCSKTANASPSTTATAAADQIKSGTVYEVNASSITLYVGVSEATTESGDITISLQSIEVTYDMTEPYVTENFKTPDGTDWNFGTSVTSVEGKYYTWTLTQCRYDKANTNDPTKSHGQGVGMWKKNSSSFVTTAEGGVKAIAFYWNQMSANESNKTDKLAVWLNETAQSNQAITGTTADKRGEDVLCILTPTTGSAPASWPKDNCELKLTPGGHTEARVTFGPITIVPYLRYTYTETQEVKIGAGTFDCSLQIDNTDDEGTITYSSSNTDVVSFASESSPIATLNDGGEATITATWGEGASTSFKLKVIPKSTPEISFAQSEITITDLYTTEPVANELTVTEGAGEVTYETSNPLVAKIVENQVMVVGVGTATITATADENDDYVSASASYTLTVNEPTGETAVKENFKGNLAKQDSYTDTEASFTDQLGLYSWKANGYRYNEVWVRLKNTQTPYLKFDGNQEGGIKRLAFTWFRAGKTTDLLPIHTSIKVMDGDNELKDASINLEASADHTNQLPYNCRIEVKQSAQLIIDNSSAPSVMHFQDISIVPYLLFTTKSDEAFLSLVNEYDVKDVLINNTDDGTVAYSILTADVQSQISNDGVVSFTNVTKSETITIQAAWTPDGESSATVITTMTLYVDVESKTDNTVEEEFSNYGETGWTSNEANEVTKNGDVYDWRVKRTRHKTEDKLGYNEQQAIWFNTEGYIATADAEDNTKIGPAEGGIKRIAFDWNQNGADQTGDDLYISISVDNEEVSAIRRDGGAQPGQPWQYIHNINVKKNATLKIENKSTTSKSEGGRVKIGTIVITPYLLYTNKEVSKMISDESYINPGLINNINKDLDGGTITFTSSDEAVATIAIGDETHKDKVVFVAAGDVTISANWTPDGEEEPAITTSYLLHITEKADRGLYFQEAVKETAVGGSAVTNTLNGTLDATEQTWSTASEGAITLVDNVGLVSPVAIGTDTVTVVVKESGAYQEGTASYKVIVRSGVADNNKLVESFSGLTKGTSDTKWEGDLKNYFSWNATSARHNVATGDTIGGAGVAGTVLFAQGQIATDGVIEGGIKYFTFNWKQPYTEQGATLRFTLNAGDKSYQQDYVVATDNGGTTHEHLYFAGNMQVKKNVQLILKNESFKTDGGAALTENGRIAIDKFEIVPYLFYKTKSHKIDVVKGDAPTWTNTDLINNTKGGTVEYSIEDVEGEGVADIDVNGQVTAKSNGKAKVTATWIPDDALDGEVVTTTYELEVFYTKLDAELTFDPKEITVGVNEPTITTPTLNNPHELTVKYSSSDETIATVDENSGEVTLQGVAGDVTISATSEETDTYQESTASYTIHVLLLTSEVTFPNLTDNEKTVNIDTDPFTENISVKVNDEEVSEPTITYESSNENAAQVDEATGEVTIISAGTTVITATVAPTETYAGTTASYTLKVEKGNVGEAWIEGFEAIEVKESYVKQEDKVTGDKGVYNWKVAYYQRNSADVIGSDKALRMRGSDAPNNHIMFDGAQEGGIKALAFDWKLAGDETNLTTYFDVTVDGTKNSFEYSGLTGGEVQQYAQAFSVRKNTTLAIEVPTGGRATIFGPISITPYLLYTTKVIEKTYDLEGTNEVDVTENLINNLEVDEKDDVTYELSEGVEATIDGSTITLANATEDVVVTAKWTEGDNTITTTFTLKVTKAEDPVVEPDVVLENKTAGAYATICLPKKIAKVENATLYSISYGNTQMIEFVGADIENDDAGMPYLVQVEADGDVNFYYAEGEPVTEPVSAEEAKGFVGSLQEDPQEIPSDGSAILVSGGQLHIAGAWCVLTQNHAYITTEYLPQTATPSSAPRRTIRLYNPEAQAPTGNPSLHHSINSSFKMIKEGHLYIVRDTKMYNAQGILVE